LKEGVPCGRCYAYKNLIDSTDPRIVYGRMLMGISMNKEP